MAGSTVFIVYEIQKKTSQFKAEKGTIFVTLRLITSI